MKKATKKARPEAPAAEAGSSENTAPTAPSAAPADTVVAEAPGPNLQVRLSEALLQKMKHSAQDEGISLEAFATELLSEGVVLRAWEIVQRNSAMRGNATGASQGQGFRPNQYNGNGNQGGGNGPRHQGGNSYGGGGGGANNNRPGRGNNAWMEDKAAFLEYVRNQEKRRR